MQYARQLSIRENKKVAGLAVSLAVVGMFALGSVSMAGAAPLDATNLSVAHSSSDDGSRSGSDLRVATADQLENAGLGLQSFTTNEDGDTSSSKLQLESIDYGQDAHGMADSRSNTNDGSSSGAAGSLASSDYAKDLQGGGSLWSSDDEGNSTRTGVSGNSSNYGLDGAGVNTESKQAAGDNASAAAIRFSFDN